MSINNLYFVTSDILLWMLVRHSPAKLQLVVSMELLHKCSYAAVCMVDIPCSTAHLEVHSADLGAQIHNTLCKLIFACNACFYYTASHYIVTIYYYGDTVHVKLFVVKVISYFVKGYVQMTSYP